MTNQANTITGWTEYYADAFGADELHVSVAPDANLDDVVQVFCHDTQQMIELKGWHFDWHKA